MEAQPTGLLINDEDAVLSIAKFLSANDCLNLHTVSWGWHHVISKHDEDEALFENYLRHDFSEGEVLTYVAQKRNLSYKKLYRTFLGRWSLPKPADAKIGAASPDYAGDRNARILISWSKQYDKIPREQYQGGKLLIPNDDVDNVIFIVRVRAEDGETGSCALMEWHPEYKKDWVNYQQLIIDKYWCDDRGNLILPKVDYIYDCSPLTLTLHVIDIHYYQVASILEDTTMQVDGCFRDEEEDSTLHLHYGYDLPTLYGIHCYFGEYPSHHYRNYIPIRGELVLMNGFSIHGSLMTIIQTKKTMNMKMFMNMCHIIPRKV